jgi:hypothetical protein
MVFRMADGKQSETELAQSRQVMATAGKVVDYGIAPLEIPAAMEITEFVDDRAPIEEVESSSQPVERHVEAMSLGATLLAYAAKVLYGIAWLIRSLFGIVSLILLLAALAAIPVVNLLALGYLLEVEGRLARSGKLRDAFPLIDLAPRLGSIVLGIWAWVFPLRLLSHAAADARLIDPGSFADVGLHLLVDVLAVLVTIHLCLALARGGSLWSFFGPVVLPVVVLAGTLLVLAFAKLAIIALGLMATPGYWTQASLAVRDFSAGLRVKHHFLLGLKGSLGAMLWLVIPTALFAAAKKTEGGPLLVTLFGGFLLIIVLSWVPFLQAHFAAENRFGAMFELGTVRRLFKNAPFSWTITMLVTLTLALPMYLFKIALPPSDAMWLVTIVFIVSIYPVKVITGWAYHRAVARERRAFFGLRWLTRLVMLPLLTVYVFLLFFTQFIGEHGKGVLFEHHAFLLPSPF